MKTIYTLFVLSIVLILVLLVASFIYLEKTSHRNFYYIIEEDGAPRGDVDIDVYLTEQYTLYKSKIRTPYHISVEEKDVRMNIEKKTSSFRNYEEVFSGNGIREAAYLKRKGDTLDFLSIAKSEFAYLDEIKVKGDVFLFDPHAPVTYIPFIKLYNFKRGGSQSFRALRVFEELMPPSKFILTLTSIKNEYVKVGNRKIKTECLVLRAVQTEHIYIWVDKATHDIVSIRIPNEKIHIKRSLRKVEFNVHQHSEKDPSYLSHKITFASKDRGYNGHLTHPKKSGLFPAVILIQGERSRHNNVASLLEDLSSVLSKNGYVTFRFEPALESQKPRCQTTSIEDQLASIKSAIDTLESFRFVYPGRIAIITYSATNYIMPLFIKNEPRIKAWIMLSPIRLMPVANADLEYIKNYIKNISKIDKGFDDRLSRTKNITVQKAEETQSNWKNISGVKVFLKRVREIVHLNSSPWNIDVAIPILVLDGAKDGFYSASFLAKLENDINRHSNEHSLFLMFKNSYHYLGKIVKSETMKTSYVMDEYVKKTITEWLDKTLLSARDSVPVDKNDD